MSQTMDGQNLSVDQDVIRIGSLCAIVGALLFMAANNVHPRSPNIQITAMQVETVAHSDIWVTDHVLLLIGGLLLLPGLIAIQRSIQTGPGAGWAYFGYVSAVVSTAIWAVLMAIDGFTSKIVHVAWATAPEGEKAVALRVAEAMEQIDVGIFSTYIIVFFGLTFILYGLAVAKSGRFPQWLGWAALAFGCASFADGIAQGYMGLSVLVTNILFAGFSSLQTLWLLTMGILMWRSHRHA
jgi:hypothetical protein